MTSNRKLTKQLPDKNFLEIPLKSQIETPVETPTETKDELLDKCVSYCITAGFSDLSLRTLAKGVGTSHRMLLYYFKSREKLLKAVLENFRHRQIESVVEDLERINSLTDFENVIRKIWIRLSSDELRSFMTAFFEFYISCVRTKTNEDSSQFLTAALGDWLTPVAAALRRLQISPHHSQEIARLMLGALRGFLLDSLASDPSSPENPSPLSSFKGEQELTGTFDLLLQAVRPLILARSKAR